MDEEIVPMQGPRLEGLALRIGEYGWVVGEVRKAAPGLWFVASDSTPGAFWEVVWHYDERCPPGQRQWFTCTCPAGRDRGDMRARFCRHVRLVEEAEKARVEPRPPAEFDPAVFVE